MDRFGMAAWKLAGSCTNQLDYEQAEGGRRADMHTTPKHLNQQMCNGRTANLDAAVGMGPATGHSGATRRVRATL